ncbi:MAG TPA: tail fiber domain-containing protein [Longimicrobium sp.]|nr:tail fiber domain-containing protein [Longimicrobium sp.]
MKTRSIALIGAALVALGTSLAPAPAAAQSDILLRLRSGSPLGDRFRVDSAGGMVAMGSIGIGIIPASGQGTRMMWYPYKAAFRAGYVDAGGQFDDANIGFYSWAGGGLSIAAGNYSFAMGSGNTIETLAHHSMALGVNNKIWTTVQFGVALGLGNNVRDDGGVAIGNNNGSDGLSAVAIGHRSTADADYSLALGHRASTNGHMGAMVIADGSTTDSLEASANNQFSVRAAGGYRLFSNATTTVGVSINAGGSSWNVISDRNRKENFLAVDGEELLARLRTLPVTTWQYRTEEDRTVRHIGPMAQDWQRAFGFSGDSTTINTGDFDGVNLAAAQALERRTAQQAGQLQALEGRTAEQMQALRAENAELRAQNHRLEERLQRVEALLARTANP